MTKQIRTLQACLLLSLANFAAKPAGADPFVEGFDLISSSRTGRTTMDYTYRLRTRGDSQSYRDAAFTLTSAATTVQIVDDTVTIGDFDAGRLLRPADTFTIRLDRTASFNPASLRFAFAGQATGIGTGASALQVGPLEFREAGGRPQHAATFSIQGDDPLAGSAIAMAVEVYGASTTASYRFLSVADQVLASGELSRSPLGVLSSPRFVSPVVIPGEPFRVEITANGNDGATLVWRSGIYRPPRADLRIRIGSALLANNETVPLRLQLRSATGTGPYNVRLRLPLGFSGNAGPWVVNAVPGQITEIETSVTAPAGGLDHYHYTITAEAEPADTSMGLAGASLIVAVE